VVPDDAANRWQTQASAFFRRFRRKERFENFPQNFSGHSLAQSQADMVVKSPDIG
jgi:hypothetical protein